MDRVEFINKMIGVPWVNRASSFDSVDCWGLVILYFDKVLGVKLPDVKGYREKDDFNLCWNLEASNKHWAKVENPEPGSIVFTCYKNDKPTHVGVVLSRTKVLHTTGGLESAGSVQVNTIRAVEKIYGKMTYHKFIG